MKFRSSVGHFLTKALFCEFQDSPEEYRVYTLSNQDKGPFRSLHNIYMQLEDPTEARIALTCFEGWDHWTTLCECGWFKPYLAKWREELEVRIRSKALAAVMDLAQTSDKSAFQANKLLLEGGWKDKADKSGVGRPSRDKIKAAAEELFRQTKETELDFQRIQ